MAKSFDELKQFLLKEKEEMEFQKVVKKVYSRPKLTRQVKKAAATTSSLECFKEENMYYSPQQTQTYLEGTSYYETYSAMRGQDSYE